MPVSIAIVGQAGEWHVLEALASSQYAEKFKLPIRGVNMIDQGVRVDLDEKIQMFHASDDESWMRALEGVDVVIDFRSPGDKSFIVDVAKMAGAKVYVTNSQKSVLPVLAFAEGTF
jgi:hypothetical protein